ncbi:hypothetical protein DRE_06828 [Drechslerella stenobrocha 248]|uniref:Uncharacterized protein n=1 Tax=Drechslerella stenobrocha 248 TaxID=1043628 RepID=W7I6N4_9PEZI|nr:hypothetical protein DRE_06828 [Drechslerella stenobrocha 248]
MYGLCIMRVCAGIAIAAVLGQLQGANGWAFRVYRHNVQPTTRPFRVLEGRKACTYLTQTPSTRVTGITIEQFAGARAGQVSHAWKQRVRYVGFWKRRGCPGLPEVVVHFYDEGRTQQTFMLEQLEGLVREEGMEDMNFWSWGEISDEDTRLWEDKVPAGAVAVKEVVANDPYQQTGERFWVFENMVAVVDMTADREAVVATETSSWDGFGTGRGPPSAVVLPTTTTAEEVTATSTEQPGDKTETEKDKTEQITVVEQLERFWTGEMGQPLFSLLETLNGLDEADLVELLGMVPSGPSRRPRTESGPATSRQYQQQQRQPQYDTMLPTAQDTLAYFADRRPFDPPQDNRQPQREEPQRPRPGLDLFGNLQDSWADIEGGKRTPTFPGLLQPNGNYNGASNIIEEEVVVVEDAADDAPLNPIVGTQQQRPGVDFRGLRRTFGGRPSRVDPVTLEDGQVKAGWQLLELQQEDIDAGAETRGGRMEEEPSNGV